MPELPDLTVIRERLAERVTGVEIVAAEVRRPLVVRSLLGGEAAEHLMGRALGEVGRRGKYLLMPLEGRGILVINPMLAGRIYYGEPLSKDRKRDVLVLALADGSELRYHDGKDMGRVYLTDDLAQIPGFAEQGPEADAPSLSLAVFAQRLRHHPGEIKWILTNQRFLAGIGNAYADEICWQAGIYPFRRRPSLSEGETAALYEAMQDVLSEAVETLRERMTRTDMEIRDFLSVHGKPGESCPRCGTRISEVKRQRRATHFCRTCQPGLMVQRGRR
jgi:formamidopyrimidine-DNA glycosylase